VFEIDPLQVALVAAVATPVLMPSITVVTAKALKIFFILYTPYKLRNLYLGYDSQIQTTSYKYAKKVPKALALLIGAFPPFRAFVPHVQSQVCAALKHCEVRIPTITTHMSSEALDIR
jgi:hypothetical protein